ncbi:hypothetical protein C0Q58_14330 [Streptomyces albidoflavus]|uniref:hypothetical protein n=1 Tax=Streptomyces albidoflavus TaxID=1886 RepID=UPI00101E4CD5|nr:hypothetical protein [Streptomyces albidoflavus]RZD62916.1 hypothetical protein C0Q58_14330 [Streptomyces albidoflavus]
MTASTEVPAPQATLTGPGQLELFRVRPCPSVTIDYARPDGGPLTDADFEMLRGLTAGRK